MGAGASTESSLKANESSKLGPPKSIPFPTLGVKLSSIEKEFYDEVCGGKENVKNLRTFEVNEQYMMKITEKRKISFCDYLTTIGRHDIVDEATVFISHAWKCKFIDVMDALQNYFHDTPDVVIWFDLFSNNQHAAKDLDFDWWTGTFKSAIKKFDHTVMVLSPWDKPISLTRGWCLFELYCTVMTGSKFSVAMTHEDKDNFLNAIAKEKAYEVVNKVLANINVENSQCLDLQDKDRIFEIVRKGGGFPKINSMIYSQLRDWILRTTEETMSKETDPLKKASFMNSLGVLYRNDGNYKRAEPLYLNCLKIRKASLPIDHPDTLYTNNNYAVLLVDLGRYQEAEPLHTNCLEKRKAILGDDHPDTLSSMINLGILYTKQKRFNDAEPLYVQCLQKRKEILGDNHVNTMGSVNNLAKLYRYQGKFDEAERLLRECYEARKTNLGRNHRDTLRVKNNIALVYHDRKDYAQAEKLHTDCLKRRKEALGENHPDYLDSLNNLAATYNRQQAFRAAKILLTECVDKRRILLGEDHPDTLESVGHLANTYKNLDELGEAEELYTDRWEKIKKMFGEKHPDALFAMSDVASIKHIVGRHEEAGNLFKNCHIHHIEIFGEGHEYTLKAEEKLKSFHQLVQDAMSKIEKIDE